MLCRLNPIDQIDQLLAGVEYRNNTVAKATGLMNIWLLKQNQSDQETAMDWELEFIREVVLKEENLPLGLTLNGFAERSYQDGVDESLNNNFTMMFGGFSLLFIYVCFSLGRWNLVEQRVSFFRKVLTRETAA